MNSSENDRTSAATPTADEPRAGRCAIVGRPNVGKSTLLNALLGQKLAIATSTPGTTRTCILGVYVAHEPPTQIAFVDTPGMGIRKTPLAKLLTEQAKTGLLDADLVLVVVEPSPAGAGVHELDVPILELLKTTGQKAVLAVNKVDRLRDKRMLLPLLQAHMDAFPFEAVVPVSAKHGTHVDELVRELRAHLPEGTLYDNDILTDLPERFFVAELIREAILRNTRSEVPHGCAVQIDEFLEDGAMTRIAATIVVDKASHKGILIGAQGAMLRQIGTDARVEIEQFLQRKAFLRLWVKVIPGWTRDPDKARRLALPDHET